MTEKQWLADKGDPRQMLAYLRRETGVALTKAGRRKLRLFACACCRVVWPLLNDTRRRLVELIEQEADGNEVRSEINKLWRQIERESRSDDGSNNDRHRRQASHMLLNASQRTAYSAAYWAATGNQDLLGAYAAPLNGGQVLRLLIRNILGNPFLPHPIPADLLSWQDGMIKKLARGIYDDRAFDRLPILADALEDAGCTDEVILGYCRGTGPHSRGDWVLDGLMGK